MIPRERKALLSSRERKALLSSRERKALLSSMKARSAFSWNAWLAGIRTFSCGLQIPSNRRRLLRTSGAGLLIRMDPGARISSHFHHDDEQCLVLEGDIGWGELIYRKGDFVVRGKDTKHPEIQTREGNLLLLVAGRNDFVL